MNVAGKSLQDIYDAGSKRLEELEKGQRSQLDETTKGHLDQRGQSEPEALKQLDARAEELQEEIRAYLEHGLERVEKLVGTEAEHTEVYVQRLVDALSLLAKKFNESISQLRQTAESQLTDLAGDNEETYKSASQATMSEVNKLGTAAIEDCRAKGLSGHAGITDLIEDHANQLLEREEESVAELLTTYDTNSESLSGEFNRKKRELEDELANKLSALEVRSMQSTQGIRSACDELLESCDSFASDSDAKLKEHLSSMLFEMSTSFDDSASRAVNDIVSLHESSMADLTMKSQELSREMDSLAETVSRGCSGRSDELVSKGKGLIGNYTEELRQRLDSGSVFQQELEKERAEMVSEIWKELGEVRHRFEEKLASLAKGTLDKMRSICDEAEGAIVDCQHNCINESKKHATDRQGAIDSSSDEFIKRVQQIKDKALEAIAKAAGAGADFSEEQAPAEATTEEDDETTGEREALDPSEIGETSAESEENGGESASADAETPKRRKRPGRTDKRGDGKK